MAKGDRAVQFVVMSIQRKRQVWTGGTCEHVQITSAKMVGAYCCHLGVCLGE